MSVGPHAVLAVVAHVVGALDGAKLVALGFEVLDNRGQGLDGGLLGGGIVHEQAHLRVIGVAGAAHERCHRHVVAVGVFRVEAPVHILVSALEQCGLERVDPLAVARVVAAVHMVAAAAGEAHNACALAGVLLDHLLNALQVGKVGVEAGIDLEVVAIGVGGHHVAIAGGLGHVGQALGPLGGDKEGGLDAVVAQYLEDVGRVGRGAVVEGEVDDFLLGVDDLDAGLGLGHVACLVLGIEHHRVLAGFAQVDGRDRKSVV